MDRPVSIDLLQDLESIRFITSDTADGAVVLEISFVLALTPERAISIARALQMKAVEILERRMKESPDQ